MQRRHLFMVLALIVCLSLCIIGCKKGENKEYQKGYAEAQSAFETVGNTKVDGDLNKDNLGVRVEQKKTAGNSNSNAQSSEAVGGATEKSNESTAVAYKYVVNTETMYIHKVDCPQVNLKLPTNQIWKGTLEEAESAGYTRDPECLGY